MQYVAAIWDRPMPKLLAHSLRQRGRPDSLLCSAHGHKWTRRAAAAANINERPMFAWNCCKIDDATTTESLPISKAIDEIIYICPLFGKRFLAGRHVIATACKAGTVDYAWLGFAVPHADLFWKVVKEIFCDLKFTFNSWHSTWVNILILKIKKK